MKKETARPAHRPRMIDRTEIKHTVGVSLSYGDIARAKKIGEGNVSMGIRKAIRDHTK